MSFIHISSSRGQKRDWMKEKHFTVKFCYNIHFVHLLGSNNNEAGPQPHTTHDIDLTTMILQYDTITSSHLWVIDWKMRIAFLRTLSKAVRHIWQINKQYSSVFLRIWKNASLRSYKMYFSDEDSHLSMIDWKMKTGFQLTVSVPFRHIWRIWIGSKQHKHLPTSVFAFLIFAFS